MPNIMMSIEHLRRVIDHDHLTDSKNDKYNSEFKLELYDLSKLPEFIVSNKEKYREFIDEDKT
jgi:hypothetical protein